MKLDHGKWKFSKPVRFNNTWYIFHANRRDCGLFPNLTWLVATKGGRLTLRRKCAWLGPPGATIWSDAGRMDLLLTIPESSSQNRLHRYLVATSFHLRHRTDNYRWLRWTCRHQCSTNHTKTSTPYSWGLLEHNRAAFHTIVWLSHPPQVSWKVQNLSTWWSSSCLLLKRASFQAWCHGGQHLAYDSKLLHQWAPQRPPWFTRR